MNQEYNPLKSRRGFTILEILIVIGVIGALATVLMILINPTEIARRSRDSKRLSDLGTLKSAIDLALSDGQDLTDTTDWIIITNSTPVANFDGGGLDVSKYLSVAPQNPGGNTQYIDGSCAKHSATSGDMAYQYRSDGSVYIVRARVESGTNCNVVQTDGNSDDFYELGTAPGLTF